MRGQNAAERRRRRDLGVGTAAGGALTMSGGHLARVIADERKAEASLDRTLAANSKFRGQQTAADYATKRTAELHEAKRTTRPEQQKVDPRVVGGSKDVVRRTKPLFRPDLVPHGKQTAGLVEDMRDEAKTLKAHMSSAARRTRSARQLKRGGWAAIAAGGGMIGAGATLHDQNQPKQRVRKSDPFEVAKANPIKAATRGARGRVQVSRELSGSGVLATRSRSGGWLLKPKAEVVLEGPRGRVSRTVMGGGLTGAGKTLATVGGVGAAAAAAEGHRKRYVRRSDVKTVRVKKGHTMSTSAFGVEHEISKSEKRRPPTAGRIITGGVVGPAHGLVAGKPGEYRKLKAATAQFGGSVLGGPIGSGLATYVAHDKGWLKEQKRRKKVSKSAFGVEDIEKSWGTGAVKAGMRQATKGNFAQGSKALKVGALQASGQANKTLKPLGQKAKSTWAGMSTPKKIGAIAGAGALTGGGTGYALNRRQR